MTAYHSTVTSDASAQHAVRIRGNLTELSRWAVHYSLVLIFLWFGALKFTAFEATAIAPLVINSPLVSWLLGPLGVAGTAKAIGAFEIATALLLAARPVQPRLSLVGGGMAMLTFLITLSFMGSTPGVVQPGGGGVLALSAMPGQFLLKDVVLLCVSAWIVAGSLDEVRARR